MGIYSETLFCDVEGIYCQATEDTEIESLDDALNIEIGQAIANSQDPSDYAGTDIITDARHETKKCIFGRYSTRRYYT